MNSDKVLLILGAGEMQVSIIQRAVAFARQVVVCDYNPDAPGFDVPGVQQEIISTNDRDAVLKVAEKYGIDGILTTSDMPVNVVSYVASALHLSSMSENVAAICTNKYLQRQLFQENNVLCPHFQLMENKDQLKTLQEFPYIVKPVDSSASRGVTRVDNYIELIQAYEAALHYSASRTVLVEQYIEGREFSVETLTQGDHTTIIAITEKLLNRASSDSFVEDAHIVPARISDEESVVIKELVHKAIRAVGINNCPTHTELKLYKGQAYLIEMACRLGGDYITSHLVPHATGVSMQDNLLKLSVGEPINVLPSRNMFAAVQFINHQNYDRCQELIDRIVQNALVIPGRIVVYEIKEKHQRPIRNSLDRMGHIIFEADSRQQLDAIFDIFNPTK